MDSSARCTRRLEVIAAIIGVCALSLSAAKKEPYSARAGDLQFVVTSLETPETVVGNVQRVPHHPIDAHHFVVVHVTVKNLGKRAACAYFTARLKAEFGIVVRRDLIFDEGPHIHELLPGEVAEGRYIFEVKDGVRPLELILAPQGKQGCATESSMFFPEVLISLQGL